LDSAITFQSSAFGLKIALMSTVGDGGFPAAISCAISLPIANVTNATGIVGTDPRLPMSRPVRSGFVLPSLKMITPVAPAACAFATFWANVQVPRWIRTGWPATSGPKSPGAQPAAELGVVVGGRTLFFTVVSVCPPMDPRLCPGPQSMPSTRSVPPELIDGMPV
jgi:hypothetical protein